MPRSVETPSNAQAVIFFSIDPENVPDKIDLDYIADDIRRVLIEPFPSFAAVSRGYAPRRGYCETRVILENDLAQVTVSEYNGLVAIALVAKSKEYPTLSAYWTALIAESWRKALAFGINCDRWAARPTVSKSSSR